MTVVVDDFEVVPAEPRTGQPPDQPRPTPACGPDDVERALARLRDRAARLEAH